ncbi:MAG: HEAT repeat domain-containing protein [Pseudomonadota bacterium]
MNFLTAYKADRLIEQLMSAEDIYEPAAEKALTKLKKLGGAAVPRVTEALASANKKQTMALVDVLSELANTKTLKHFIEGLSDGDPRVVSGTAWALSSSKQVDPSAILQLLDEDEISTGAVLEVINTHKDRLSVPALLSKAYDLQPNEQAVLFRMVGNIVREEQIPDLLARLTGKDPIVRMHIIEILSRFNRPDVAGALENQLNSNNKMIRVAALNGLSKMGGGSNIKLICSLLTDTDVDVQNKAVDVIVRINHPDTIRHLIPALKDENEFSRRAAVEVLNEIGTPDSIKDLLNAVRDDDWWVRARASDALAQIGGPRVVKAVMRLVKDEDQEIRRAAIEILNATKDPQAFDQLLHATKDDDWWVRERAVDALAEIGDTRAVPVLAGMLGKNEKSDPTVVRALGKLGDRRVAGKIAPMMLKGNREIRVEAMKAVAMLVQEGDVAAVRDKLIDIQEGSDHQLSEAADLALETLQTRFSEAVREQNRKAEKLTEGQAGTLLLNDEEANKALQEAAEQVAKTETGPLDISTLEPGDVVENRYRFVKRIGKGAFGTVLLMEDTVVGEELILKFLNPNVSSDEEMMKRFVHELKFSRRITHPNVIRIYDFLHIQGNYAISMEYFDSHTLGAEIAAEKPMPFAKALGYANDIATGMGVAHGAGVIHRDLKPANILIDETGLLKIVDFGVAAAAKSGDTQLTKTGYVIGSPKYMAPEQILGKKVEETADIYSLGVILYEMITGSPPYTRGDHMSVMYQHVQGKAAHCQELNDKIPDDLAAIVTKLMSVDKAERHQSMQEVRDALESVKL